MIRNWLLTMVFGVIVYWFIDFMTGSNVLTSIGAGLTGIVGGISYARSVRHDSEKPAA